MMTHLTVISYTRDFQSLFENIDNTLQAGMEAQDEKARYVQPSDRYVRVERCQNWRNLPNVVLNVGRSIDLLDLVGHGSSADFELGDTTFLGSSSVEPSEVIAVLKKVQRHLSDEARVRILGCETGVGDSGLKMLKSVSKVLEREVLGTTVELLSTDFGRVGLSEQFASKWLYSSKNNEPSPAGSRDDSAPLVAQGTQSQKWEKKLQGYRVVGRGEPFSTAGFSLRVQGMNITFASDRRVVLIKDRRDEPPLMLRWDEPGPAPSLKQLLPSLEKLQPSLR